MDSIRKNRIASISIGVILLAAGILFITSFPAYSEYSGNFILGGVIGVIIGFLYPFPKIERQKSGLRGYFEGYWNLNKNLRKVYSDESRKLLYIGLTCLLSGLGLGLLTYYLMTTPEGQASVNQGNMSFGIFLVIAVLLFFSGFILFLLGFVWTQIDIFKHLKKTEDNQSLCAITFCIPCFCWLNIEKPQVRQD
jgi:drug/metabolite transporter (DMT)-like permease